jgi:hypothetical protein
MQKLANAADDAKQIIGEGLLDALTGLGEDDSVQNLASSMQNFATETANVIRGIGKLIEKIQALDDKVPDWLKFDVGMVPIVGSWYKIASAAGTIAGVQKASDNQHLQSLQQQYKIDTKISKISTKLTADQLKKLKAKKLEQAIDKANLALNKGEEVFDMDKIQIAAALTNQAEQLGKATSSAQVLQIANDTARLNVKRSILALEDAIAAKDEAAIIAATAKLNADLKVLNALTGQNTQMAAIKSILDGLKPKSLIDQANLDEALRKIKEMLDMLAKLNSKTGGGGGGDGDDDDGGGGGGGGGTIPKLLTPDEINKILEGGGFVPIVPDSGGTTKGGSSSAGAYAASGFPGAAAAIAADAAAAANAAAIAAAIAAAEEVNRLLESGSFVGITAGRGGSMGGSSSAGAYAASGFPGAGGSGSSNVNITVNTGIGDPEAIARAVEDVVRQSYQRGTSATGLLAV